MNQLASHGVNENTLFSGPKWPIWSKNFFRKSNENEKLKKMKKRIKKSKKNQENKKLVKFICPRQPDKGRERQRQRQTWEGTFFKKIF